MSITSLDLAREYVVAAREFRQILAEMELVSYGKTQAFNSSGGGRSENPDPTPTGESWPMHLRWRAEWAKTKPSNRPDLVRDARTELEAWRLRCVTLPDDEYDEAAWIIEDGEGLTPEHVARRHNTTPSRIRSLRIRAGRDPETGHKLAASGAPPRVQDLVERGLGARQIAMLTGVARSTAQDAINRHRKLAA